MSSSSPNPALRRAGKFMVFLIIVLILGVIGLNLIVDHIGRIPDDLRTEPPIIASLQNQPARTPLPLPPIELEKPNIDKEKLAVETLRKSAWDMEFHQLFGPYCLEGFVGYYETVPIFRQDQQKWLSANAPLIDSLKALIAECAANPAIIRESITETDVSADLSPNSIPGSLSRISTVCQILFVNAKYQLGLNNPAKARASMMSALSLMDFCIRDKPLSRNVIMEQVERSLFPVVQVILMKRSPASDWPGLPEALERLDAELFDIDALEREIVGEYREQRARLVWQLEGSWAQPIFGFHKPEGGPLKIASMDFVLNMVDSMKNKARSAELLKQFDAEKQEVLKGLRMPYDVQSALDRSWVGIRRFLPNLFAESSIWAFHIGEYEMHLARAGLLWRDDRPKAEVLRKQDLLAHNPWRDPLSTKSLAVDETANGTVLRSTVYGVRPTDPGTRLFVPR